MKKIAALVAVLAIVAMPMAAGAQTTTNTAFQVVNLSQTADANVTITFYDQAGAEVYSFDDTISAGSDSTYIQADMSAAPPAGLGSTFNGSAVISSDQEVAAIVNQNTANADNTEGYNGSYTGFTQGSETFYIPIVLNAFYGYYTEISIQNASDGPVDVTVTYDTAGCSDSKTALAVGAAVRFSNLDTCDGGLNPNGSAVVSATGGDVVAVVNQIVDGKLEQTYNGFGPADASDTLYTPIALHAFYGFNSAFQVQNVSGATMDVCATYSDGLFQCVTAVGDGDAATFLQGDEAHVANWTGSAMITNTTDGDMVGIVNQQSNKSAASFNMFAGGSGNWVLPSLLYKYYGFTSAFQVQNISSGAVDIDVTYSDGVTASADGVAAGGVATFIQNDETTHTNATAFSAVVEATGGDIVIVVNQDVLSPGAFDYQYSYNAVPTD